MLCPVCRSPLVEHEPQRLQSLSEHVSDPNGEPSLKMAFVCMDPACLSHKSEMRWTDSGERYGGFDFEGKFIGDNDAPFGTYQRQANVEIYKQGLKEYRTLCTIGDIRFDLEYHYRSNQNGDVLGRSWSLRKLKKERGSLIYYEFPVVSFYRNVKDGLKTGLDLRLKKAKLSNGFQRVNFCVTRHEDRWWRLWSVRVNRFFFPSLVKDLKFRGL